MDVIFENVIDQANRGIRGWQNVCIIHEKLFIIWFPNTDKFVEKRTMENDLESNDKHLSSPEYYTVQLTDKSVFYEEVYHFSKLSPVF